MFEQKKQEPLFPDFSKKKEEPKKETKVEVPKLELKDLVKTMQDVKKVVMVNICAACYHKSCGYHKRMELPEGDPRIRP